MASPVGSRQGRGVTFIASSKQHCLARSSSRFLLAIRQMLSKSASPRWNVAI
jgi:hypothetical protein